MRACHHKLAESPRPIILTTIGMIVIFVLALPSSITVKAVSEFSMEQRDASVTVTTSENIASFLPIIYKEYCGIGEFSPTTQWNMQNIHADDAWQSCNLGSSNVIVAVVDSGVDLDHPDLVANLLAGKDYVDGDTTANDEYGHGTHVTGIIAASLNGIGVVGLAPNIKILPVRVLDENGGGYTSDVASAIRWSADRAQVISLSLGAPYDEATDQVLKDAVDYAVNKGRLVVAAAGNCGYGYNLPSICNHTLNEPLYPAAYNNVLAVGSVDKYDNRSYFSSSVSYLDISAPGSGIYSTIINGYGFMSGTSMATPHVSGLAALIWSKYPALTANQVRDAIIYSADDLGTVGLDIQYGWGRINTTAALTAAASLASGASSFPAAVESESQTVETLRDDREADILEGYVLVQFDAQASAQALEQALATLQGVAVEKTIPELGVIRLTVPAGEEWATIDALRQRSDVLYAGPEYVYQMIDPVEVVENEPAGE